MKFEIIYFQGIPLPRSTMGISTLGAITPSIPDEVDTWLWTLRTCFQRSRSFSSQKCIEYAEKAINVIHAEYSMIVIGIQERFHSNEDEAHIIVKEWLEALRSIKQVSTDVGVCEWVAMDDQSIQLKSKNKQ